MRGVGKEDPQHYYLEKVMEYNLLYYYGKLIMAHEFETPT